VSTPLCTFNKSGEKEDGNTERKKRNRGQEEEETVDGILTFQVVRGVGRIDRLFS